MAPALFLLSLILSPQRKTEANPVYILLIIWLTIWEDQEKKKGAHSAPLLSDRDEGVYYIVQRIVKDTIW